MLRTEALDGYLPTLAVIISLALTALTLTAVVRQGQTLEAREWADVRAAAEREAATRVVEFAGDVVRWTEAAERALHGGPDALDEHTLDHTLAHFIAVQVRGEPLSVFPLTPTQAPLPTSGESALRAGTALAFEQNDLLAALRYYESLTDTDDRDLRAAAFMASGATQRKLGALRSAAANYQRAADLLDAAPRGLRGVFGARLAAFDCLFARDDAAAAQRELERLSRRLADAPPGAWGRGELALVEQRWQQLGTRAAPEPFALWAETLRERAGNRDAVPELERVLYRLRTSEAASTVGDVRFASLELPEAEPMLVAAHAVQPDVWIALATPRIDVVNRYWRGINASQRWRAALPEAAQGIEPLVILPEAFGGAVLIPSGVERRVLERSARWRVIVLVGVTVGTTLAWTVVIWLILRGLAQQRELVTLQRRFVADVSHELKTPLALIRLHAETLAEGRLRDEDRKRAYVDTIARESERLTLLLDNILDFSRIEAGRKEYVFEPCDPGAVVEQAWTLFKPRFADAGFEMVFERAAQLPMIEADSQALQQVVINLLQNAYRYAGDRRYVRLAVVPEADHIQVSVTDRGLGMSRGQIRRLGALFERGDNPEVRKTRGTGLGLAIVKHIVAAHGGRLDVQSEQGVGSTFTVRLPVTTAPAQA